MNLVNCPRCNKLFAKHFRDVCNNCHQELESKYNECVEVLRKNKGLTIQELADETDTSIKQITRWIREGRISLVGAPNLTYPCELCGVLIREGSMCDGCRTRLQRDVRAAQSAITEAAQRVGDSQADGVYKVVDRYKEQK